MTSDVRFHSHIIVLLIALFFLFPFLWGWPRGVRSGMGWVQSRYCGLHIIRNSRLRWDFLVERGAAAGVCPVQFVCVSALLRTHWTCTACALVPL